MRVYNYNRKRLEALLKEHGVPLTDAVKRGKFYEEYFDWDRLSEEYTNGKSIRDICRECNLSYDVVRVNLKKRLGSLRAFKAVSDYTFKEDLLFPMTNIGAYFMGWLYSDGYVVDKTKFGITLSAKDTEHLSYLVNLVCDKPVYVRKNKVCFDFYGTQLTSKLQKEYLVVPNKSHTNLKIPLNMFSGEQLPYLLLGLLDGDGSISKKCVHCSMLLAENTYTDIVKAIKDKVDLSSTHTCILNEYGLLNMTFSGKSYFSFLHYIYANTSEVVPLQRKFKNFALQLVRSMNGRTSPYKKLACQVWDSLKLHSNLELREILE